MTSRRVDFNVFAAETLIERIEGPMDRAKRRFRIQNFVTTQELDALKLMAQLVQVLVAIEENHEDDTQSPTPEA